MINKKKLYSITLVSAAIILILVNIAGASQSTYNNKLKGNSPVVPGEVSMTLSKTSDLTTYNAIG
jgi:hypothetical protein